MRILGGGLALLAVVLTLLPMLPAKTWWIRIWEFPRAHIAAVGGIGIALFASDGAWTVAGATVIAMAVWAVGWQLFRILPYTPLWPTQARLGDAAREGDGFSLVVVNVLMKNRETARLRRILEEADPDIVFALETDGFWVDALASMLPRHGHRVLFPLDNTYGLALFSRLELVAPEVRFLIKPDNPSLRTGVRLRSGRRVTLIGLHPEPPSPTEAPSSRPRDAELVLVGREIAALRGPVVVAGDLNDVAWSHTSRLFRRVSGLLDPRVGRGFYHTFHAGLWPVRWPLDHVFYAPAFTLRGMSRLGRFGSDHFPIQITLDLTPDAARDQEPRPPELDDLEEVRATIAEGRRNPV